MGLEAWGLRHGAWGMRNDLIESREMTIVNNMGLEARGLWQVAGVRSPLGRAVGQDTNGSEGGGRSHHWSCGVGA